jgi:hypothetical protein
MFFRLTSLYQVLSAITLSSSPDNPASLPKESRMDYHDRYAMEREMRRLRREEIGRLEIAVIEWLQGHFRELRERLAAALHHPHSA